MSRLFIELAKMDLEDIAPAPVPVPVEDKIERIRGRYRGLREEHR
ncbi:hypothetical protein CCACVL1_09277 [Corchorus capsularis]|uniref:Uncharacterized protein n=1 Tax=Corchorus capsularis TaxID=210143 RepID=A0A1R3IWV0_COCAP|nr:hypothetical protein CCACVL1_09277 [Corchorus capsularis]